MPKEAIDLFDNNPNVYGLAFVPLLKAAGWSEHKFENSTLMKKDGCEAVFKLFNMRAYSIQDGYEQFVQELLELGQNRDEYPHLPIIYRYRSGVCVQERLGVVDAEALDEWGYEMAVVGDQFTLDGYYDEERSGEFIRASPKLMQCMMLLLKVITYGQRKSFRLRLSIKAEDILQRPDGTFVMVDPIL